MSSLSRFTTTTPLVLLSHAKVEPKKLSKHTQIFAKFTSESYTEIWHYSGYSPVGSPTLGGRRFKGSLFSGPLFFSWLRIVFAKLA